MAVNFDLIGGASVLIHLNILLSIGYKNDKHPTPTFPVYKMKYRFAKDRFLIKRETYSFRASSFSKSIF